MEMMLCITGGKLSPGETQEIELGVGAFEPTLNVQLWKNYEDEMEIYLENPAGERVGPLSRNTGCSAVAGGKYRTTDLLWKTGTVSCDAGDLCGFSGAGWEKTLCGQWCVENNLSSKKYKKWGIFPVASRWENFKSGH